MTMQPELFIQILPQDELVLQVRYPSEGESVPVRVPRSDLLYAMLCTAGANLKIPCRKMIKEEPC